MSETTTPGTVPQISEESDGIRNKEPSIVAVKSRNRLEEMTEKQSQLEALLQQMSQLTETVKTSVSTAKRKARDFRYNKRDFDETKKDEAFNLLHKAMKSENIKPNMIKRFFYDNNLYFPFGYTKTEIATAYIEHEGKEDEWELGHIKDRVHMWISKANTELNARITWTKLDDGRKIYHIAKHAKDFDGPMSSIGTLTGRLLDSHDWKKDLKREIEKEETQEQKQSQEILVDTQGNEEVNK